jgi:putative hemolysin
MAELGRSCVDAKHRSGSVILMLWGALANFMTRNRLDFVVGSASMSMRDGGHAAASLWDSLRQTEHLAPVEQRVQPRLPLPVNKLHRNLPGNHHP